MRFVLAGTLLVCSSTFSFAQPSPVLLTDMLKIKQPGNVEFNTDGTKVFFTLTESVKDEKQKWEYPYHTQLWVAETGDGAAPKQLTFGDENATQPALSANGKHIAFVRKKDGRSQVHILPLTGGEAKAITNEKFGAASPVWHPDDKRVLYSVSFSLRDYSSDSILNPNKTNPSWPMEKPGLKNEQILIDATTRQDPDGNLNELRAWLLQNENDNKAKVINQLNFQEEAVTSSRINLNHWFITTADGQGTAKQITYGFLSYANAQWVGSGDDIILEAANDSLLHPDRARLDNAVYLLHTQNGAIRKLLGAKDSSFSNATISPSGKLLAFTYGASNFNRGRTLSVMPLGGKRISAIDIPHDRSISSIRWSSDEQHLYFTSPSNGGVVLYRYNLTAKKVEQLTGFDEGISSFDVKNNRMAYVKTAVSNPFELFVGDAQTKSFKRISSFNSGWVNNKQLSYPVKRTFTNDIGLTVEYWVMKPTNWQQGKKYPVILEIHGGPTAMWGPGESSMWHEFQYYCSKGYAVVYANPRGSGGYGENFMRSNINDWGNGPMTDVLTALDRATEEFSWMDKSNMAVTGGSYAGYLIGYMLGHDTRFKVACAQRGVYDLRTFFGEGNAWRLVPNYFGGYPWEKTTHDILERESPINYVQHITTPLIIFHGEQDLRTGVIQSEQFYRSLKVLNKHVEYVRHPGATHEITRSGNNRQRMDQMLRTYEFFERYITH